MRAAVAALAALALLALTPAAQAAPSPRPLIGIADQKPDMFSDPRFLAAHVPIARLQVEWDVMSRRLPREKLAAWLAGAQAAGVRPLITFGHKRGSRKLPTPRRLGREFRKLRRAWPWVREFATWNEVNHCGERVCRRPALVAKYWRTLRKACAGRCTVLAAEVLDVPNMLRWVRAFRRAVDFEPAIWGLHNYVGVNRLQSRSTRQFLRAVRGRVWLTETGGLIERNNRSTVDFEESPRHAAKVTKYLLGPIARLSPRIERIYLFHWNAGPDPTPTWDSGLFSFTGQPRPAWRIVRSALRRHAAARSVRLRRRGAARSVRTPAPAAP